MLITKCNSNIKRRQGTCRQLDKVAEQMEEQKEADSELFKKIDEAVTEKEAGKAIRIEKEHSDISMTHMADKAIVLVVKCPSERWKTKLCQLDMDLLSTLLKDPSNNAIGICGIIRGTWTKDRWFQTIDKCDCGLINILRMERDDGNILILEES